MQNTIYSIGYTAFNIDEFIKVLQNYNIKCVIDVRSSAFSQFYTNYNKNEICSRLNLEKIEYRNYADEFGARQDEQKYYSSEGYLDFNKFILSDNFNKGVDKIKKGYGLGYTFCLMCAETNPIDCHRSIMVGRGLKEQGFNVEHILKTQKTINQSEIEKSLLDYYFENRNQISMFKELETDEELTLKAYDRKNKEIGFRKKEE